jgi:hypothetical protein
MNTRKFIVSNIRKSTYELEVDALTLMFLDTLMAELNAAESLDSDYADYFECKN